MNRCGASVKDACRYPCEEVRLSSPTSPQLPYVYAPLHLYILLQVCEYKDTSLFSGFFYRVFLSYFSLQPTKQNCAPPYEWENTDDSLWYDRHGESCSFRRHTPQKCANITSAEKQFICSSSVCGG